MKRMFLAAVLAAVAAAPASAATLYVGHGIDGRDLGADKDLAVDVCSGSAVLLTGVKFGQFAQVKLGGKADLPVGRYDVQVRLSDGKCGGPEAISTSFFLNLTENATAIAHLTEQGTPTITKFVNDVRPLAGGQARLYARHAAAFGNVNVYLRNGKNTALIRDLENPDQEGANLPAGTWNVSIYPSSSWYKPAFSANLPLEAGTAYFAYAVGSPANGTFTVLPQAIKLN